MDRILAIAVVVSLGLLALLFVAKWWIDARFKAAKRKKDAVVAEIARRGGSVEIAGIRKSLEQSMADYTGPDREEQLQALNHFISNLEAKYGTHIPFDESVKLTDDLEAYFRDQK